MTEANPPAQPNELCRRILFLLKEKDRRGDYPYLSDIAKDLGETPEDIKDQLDIMKDLGLAEVTFFIDEDAQPFITGTGKLKLEQWGQEAPEVKVSPPASENLFLREGDSWTLKFGSDQPIRVRDSVGLVYIHHLIQHPGYEFPVLMLVQQTRGAAAVGRTTTAAEAKDADLSPNDSSGMGPLMDARALEECWKRIKDLEEDIDEAEQNNNSEAAANAREEKQKLEAAISGSLGLGGRARPVGSRQEKARKAVSKAIHRAIINIKNENQHLGDHLNNAIYIGAYVSYRPESSVDWHH